VRTPSDETYEAFVFEGAQHISPKSKNTISMWIASMTFLPLTLCHVGLHSFSKSYGMAGWRMGYLAVPAHVVVRA
jgi:aspartate/methionine/tyrosine aminotransferase